MKEIESIVNRIITKEISIDDLTEEGKRAVIKYLEKADKKLQKHLNDVIKQKELYQKNTESIKRACDRLDRKMEE